MGVKGEIVEVHNAEDISTRASQDASPEREVVTDDDDEGYKDEEYIVVTDDDAEGSKENAPLPAGKQLLSIEPATMAAETKPVSVESALNASDVEKKMIHAHSRPIYMPEVLRAVPSSETERCLDDRVRGHLVRQSLVCLPDFFTEFACQRIEACIEGTAYLSKQGFFRCPRTVDSTPYRTKYFFGHGYTYGKGREDGVNELLPEGSVDSIPDWIMDTVVAPLVERKVIPEDFVNSVVINDYFAGGSIVSHIDPPKLFDRPIVTVSFFGDASLVFGASFDPNRKTPPVHSQYLPRGSVLVLQGYSADGITHGIRPEDLISARRTSLVLRHVRADAPIVGTAALVKIAEKRSELIRTLQGWWRDEWGSSKFLVNGMNVLVFDPTSTTPKQSWRMHVSEDGNGVVCGNGKIMSEAIDQERIEWEPVWGAHGFTWTKLQQPVDD